MKILMFGWEFPPHISGGLGTACFGLTKAMSRLGDLDITFVVPKAYGDEDKSSFRLVNAGDIEVIHELDYYNKYSSHLGIIQVSSSLRPYLTPEEYKKHVNKISKHSKKSGSLTSKQKFSFSGKYGAQLYEEMYRYSIIAAELAHDVEHDIIHAHDWMTYPAGIEAKRVSGKPLVVHVHATEFDRCGENYNEKVYALEKRGMEAADLVITVSNYTRNIVINRYHINPAKVVTIHNGVDLLEAPDNASGIIKDTNEKIVTYLGRITYQKGPEYFVRAAKKVLDLVDNVRFVMVGEGDLYINTIKQVAKLGIATKFHFTGFLNEDGVRKIFGMSDLYVMPSVSEPFGISPLEAMKSKVPVIITKQSGVSEVLKNAIKVDFWNIDAMADAIYSVITYESMSNMMRKQGQTEADTLTWHEAAVKLRTAYGSLVSMD